jgi:alkylhydroperoxidase family enzyme
VPQAIAGEARKGEPKNRNRIHPVDPQHVTGKARRLLEQVRAKLGFVPNLFRVLANAPVALESYVNFSAALAGGTLNDRIREQIALGVAENNLCGYCLNMHQRLPLEQVAGSPVLVGQNFGLR